MDFEQDMDLCCDFLFFGLVLLKMYAHNLLIQAWITEEQ